MPLRYPVVTTTDSRTNAGSIAIPNPGPLGTLTTPFSHLSEDVSLLTGMSVSPLNSVNGTGLGIHDAKIAAWLKKNKVTTVYGPTRFDGPYNHGDAAQLIKQVQNKEWKVVWPKEFAAPGGPRPGPN